MTPTRILGVMALVLGIILLAIGRDSSNALADQLSDVVTGRYTDRTMWYIITGAVAAVGGGLLIVFGDRGKRL
jgi:drug/metabolite transporter (DMT)-like permease